MLLNISSQHALKFIKKEENKIIFPSNLEDVQNVARQELDRELIDKELKLVEDKIADYIDWYGAIELTINDTILNKK